MRRSGDLLIGGSGDRKGELTAETRSRGENEKPTTEARRHGEGSGDLLIARDRVIGVAANGDQDVLVAHTIDLCHPERVGADATASRRIPTLTVPGNAAAGSSYETANLTAETRSRGENEKPTTEARRHREESGDRVIARDRVIGKAACICHPERAGANATANRRIPKMPVLERAASGSSYEALKGLLPRLTSAIQTFLAAIREIFDESPYDRFLLRTNAKRSVASYRDFTRERDSAMLKKPRCC